MYDLSTKQLRIVEQILGFRLYQVLENIVGIGFDLYFDMTNETDYVNNFAQWQPDEDMQNCLNCHTPFSFLVRKHHCRCCGGIFCGSCTEKFARYDKKRVRVIKRSPSDEEFPPFRTCDSCYDNLLHLKLLLSPWGKRLEFRERSIGQGETTPPSNSVSPTPVMGNSEVMKPNGEVERTQEVTSSEPSSVLHVKFDEDHFCPICNLDLSKLNTEEDAQNHVEDCIQKAVKIQQHQGLRNEIGSPTFQNRMLVYKVRKPNGEDERYPECPICFEEMVPGEKVGRLECLCVFHYKCIKGWFN